MSWSVSVIGTPEKVNAYLDKYGSSLTDQSKIEFDETAPSLKALIALNTGISPTVKVDASGHAVFTNGEKMYGTCNVSIQPWYGTLAL